MVTRWVSPSWAANIQKQSLGRVKVPGVLEIVESHDGDTYRAVYTVRFEGAIYVLHAFQKKSPSGVRTAAKDIALIRARLRRAQQDCEATK